MSLKQEIETWVAALNSYDNQEFDEAVKVFQPIADTSKILFNCGVIRATLGEHEAAVEYYQRAVGLDQYLAVAYFQQGVSNFLLGDFEEALANFNDTLYYLRGNNYINYEQLGLKFKLHSCEALFNRGLCYVYLQQTEAGITDMVFASKEKAIPEHEVIDEAIKERAEGYTVFSIPVGVVFRPSEAKVKNMRTKNYLGKARLVAQAPEHRRQMSMDEWAVDDRPADQLSYASKNLVRPNLSSRSRQQSEPPIQRNVFPPTPPPESEKPKVVLDGSRPSEQSQPRAVSPPRQQQSNGRSSSLNRRPPQPLELGAAAFVQKLPEKEQKLRRVPARSLSEEPRRANTFPLDERQKQEESHRRQPRLFGAIDEDIQQETVAPTAEPYTERTSSLTNNRRSHGRAAQRQHRPHYIEEENGLVEMAASPDSLRRKTASLSISSEASVPQVIPDDSISLHNGRSSVTTQRTSYGPATLKNLRVKAHLGDDTRYVIVTPEVQYSELRAKIGAKFGFIGGKVESFKIRSRDEEGDMITMGDQEDLDMALVQCREVAEKEGVGIGKLELFLLEV